MYCLQILVHYSFVESKESGILMPSNFVIRWLLRHLIILTMFIDHLFLELIVIMSNYDNYDSVMILCHLENLPLKTKKSTVAL